MKDDLHAAHGVVHAFVRPELALDDLDVEPGEVRAVAGGEVVEHTHLVSSFEQRAREVGSDEPSASGDERSHVSLLANDTDAAATPTLNQVSAASGMPATRP